MARYIFVVKVTVEAPDYETAHDSLCQDLESCLEPAPGVVVWWIDDEVSGEE